MIIYQDLRYWLSRPRLLYARVPVVINQDSQLSETFVSAAKIWGWIGKQSRRFLICTVFSSMIAIVPSLEISDPESPPNWKPAHHVAVRTYTTVAKQYSKQPMTTPFTDYIIHIADSLPPSLSSYLLQTQTMS